MLSDTSNCNIEELAQEQKTPKDGNGCLKRSKLLCSSWIKYLFSQS